MTVTTPIKTASAALNTIAAARPTTNGRPKPPRGAPPGAVVRIAEV